jgi:hypothetical protein
MKVGTDVCIAFAFIERAACGITLNPLSSIPLVPQIRAAQVAQRSTSKEAFGLKVLSLQRYEERVAVLQALHQGGVARSTLVREYGASVYQTVQVYQLGEDDATNPDPLSSTHALMRRTKKGLFRVVHSANVFDVLCDIHYEQDTKRSASLTRHMVRIQQLYITERLIKRFVATSPHVTDDRCGPSLAPANSLLGRASTRHSTGQSTLQDKRPAATNALVRHSEPLHDQEKNTRSQASETTLASKVATYSLVTPPTATRTMVQTSLPTRKDDSTHHQSKQAIATTASTVAKAASPAKEPIIHGVDPVGRKLNVRQSQVLDFIGGQDPEGNESFTNANSMSRSTKSPPRATNLAEATGRSREPASDSDDDGLWTFQPFARSSDTKSIPAKQHSGDRTTYSVVEQTLAQKRSRMDPNFPSSDVHSEIHDSGQKQPSNSLVQRTFAETHATVRASQAAASPAKQLDKCAVRTKEEVSDDDLPCFLLKPARLVPSRDDSADDSDLCENEMSEDVSDDDDDLPCIHLSSASVHAKQKRTTTPRGKQSSAIGSTKILAMEGPLADRKVPAKRKNSGDRRFWDGWLSDNDYRHFDENDRVLPSQARQPATRAEDATEGAWQSTRSVAEKSV